MASTPRPLPTVLQRFIHEVENVVAATANRSETITRLYSSFAALLHDPTTLHPDYRHPVPGQFAQYAIYRAADGSLSIMAMVVPPGVATPVHDHRAWGLVGVYQGEQRERVYRRMDDGTKADYADLRQVAENILKIGDITTLLPPEGDIHMIETISDIPSISLHVLGNDIGCVHRHRYDVAGKAVHGFTSGYVNTACTTYRLGWQHLVVADVHPTVAFYERTFGAQIVERTEINGVPLVRLDLNGSEMLISGAIVPGLRSHYCLIADDFDAAVEELKKRQVEFLSTPLSLGTRRVAFITDGDGHQIGVASS
jgi:predicted metal-dependent enzyme (double-stranded beta helix superfamily)/predicted enzyme related to lactoylglutathione lyase